MQRRYRTRTTTGCLTCRMRRKKCNEEKPICIGCQRNHLICTWPTDGKTAHEVSLSRTGVQKLPTATAVAVTGPSSGAGTLNTEQYRQFRAICSKMPIPHPLELMPGLRKAADKHIFDHYIGVTALQMAGRQAPRNAFLSHLIPVAYQDARVVSCILALSGAQLCFRSDQFEHNARSHYAVTLRSVKHALLDWRSLSAPELMGLLTATLMLCFFEIIIGDIQGNFFYHLRASRTLLVELRENRANQVDQSLLDLLTEFYAFFAINSNVTLNNDLPVNRYIPEDSFLSSKSLVELNRGTDIYGVLFGAAHELLGLIMPIARSARYYLQHKNNEQRDINLRKYEKEIRSWTFVPFQESSPVQSLESDPYEAGAQLFQYSILIFLYTTFHGPNPPTPELITKVEECLEKAIEAATKIPLEHPVQTTMPWPSLICASVMRNENYRELLRWSMDQCSVDMLSKNRNLEFMIQMWKDQDEDELVYGPYGIELVMRRRGINLCVA